MSTPELRNFIVAVMDDNVTDEYVQHAFFFLDLKDAELEEARRTLKNWRANLYQEINRRFPIILSESLCRRVLRPLKL